MICIKGVKVNEEIDINTAYDKDVMWDCDDYFDMVLDDEYKVTEFSKRVAKEIDNTEIIDVNVAVSSILGGIPLSDLSTGVKSLILVMYTDLKLPLSYFGENCYKFLEEIGSDKDFILVTSQLCSIQQYLGKNIPIKLVNNGRVYTNPENLIMDMVTYV